MDALDLENGIAKIFKYSTEHKESHPNPNVTSYSGKPTVTNNGIVIDHDQSSNAYDQATRFTQENTWYEYTTNSVYSYSCVILDASFL